MSLNLDEESVRRIVRGVLQQIQQGQGAQTCSCASAPKAAPAVSAPRSEGKGIFTDVAAAASAAHDAYKQLCKGGMEMRKKVIDIVKGIVSANAKEWGTFEYNETKIGKLEDKISKLEILKLVPGVEWIRPDAYSGDHGIMLEEY